MAIAAVGRAEWGMEWSLPRGKGVFGWTKDQVEKGGMEAVLRCPVGWSGDHRVVSLLPAPSIGSHSASWYMAISCLGWGPGLS